MPGWDDEDDWAALVMLAPLAIGTLDPEAISRFTGVPLAEVRGTYDRLAENGVLGPDGNVHLEWDDPKPGKQMILLDVFVATVKLRRARRQVVVLPAGGGSGH